MIHVCACVVAELLGLSSLPIGILAVQPSSQTEGDCSLALLNAVGYGVRDLHTFCGVSTIAIHVTSETVCECANLLTLVVATTFIA